MRSILKRLFPRKSSFTVVADKFNVMQGVVAGGDPVPVCSFGMVGGTPKLAFRCNVIGDGSVSADRAKEIEETAFKKRVVDAVLDAQRRGILR